MERNLQQYKWRSLAAFALMYNFVYLGRFNVSYFLPEIGSALDLSAMQQNLIVNSVLVAYAAGSFVNGYMADRWGAKRTVLLGGIMSGLLNIVVPMQTHWIPVLLIWLANGYFQSMIWVGGISLLANWWEEGERGLGVGVANFFSGMSHTTAYLIPIFVVALWPQMSWQWSFAIPMVLLLLSTWIFSVAAVEKPEEKGLPAYSIENNRHIEREQVLEQLAQEGRSPWKHFFSQQKFLWWCAIAMLSSICRYGLLNWIPLYFNEKNGGAILSETFSELTLPVGMAFGTLIITWIAGTKLFNNKGIIVTAMAALCGTLVMIFPMVDNSQAVLVGIFFTGFALYGINGILWLHAIDQGCRIFAGTAAGIFNGFAYLGACLEGVVFPAAMKLFEASMTVFVVMEVLCICMVICGMAVSKKNTVIVPEVRE
ncbi:MAG: MFS transporter [Firmicutes bacterium]|nr:MFS transporter [Bacillota bacterium]